jgi:hypothetical protein
MSGRELGQPPATTADVEHALAAQVDQVGDHRRLRAFSVAPPHVYGLKALTVEPFAPNLIAF